MSEQTPNVPSPDLPPLTPKNANGVAGKPMYTTVEANGHVFDSFNATNTFQPSQNLDAGPTAAELHQDKQLPNLRTFESDIAEAVKQKDVSVVKIAVAQRKKEPEHNITDPKRTAYLFTLSLILIIGSAMSVVIVYFFHTHLSALKPTITPPAVQSFISAETTKDLVVKPADILSDSLVNTRDAITANHNSITHIALFESTSTPFKIPMPAEDFIDRLQTTIPSWLVRSIKPDFMFGFYMADTAQPFIILKTDSYENAFSGMLKWEGTIRDDKSMQALFNISTATSTTQNVFSDMIVRNEDVRVLNDESGNPILLYSLPDKQTIIITNSINALKEIISRLTSAKFVQ